MEAREIRIHRLAGILGVFGMFLGVLADLASGYAPGGELGSLNVYSVSLDTWREVFLRKPHSHLVWGHYLSVLGIPCGLFGLWHVYRAIRPAGFWLSVPAYVLGTFGYAVGTVFHATVGFMAAGAQAQAQAEGTSRQVLDAMMIRFLDFFGPLGFVFLLPIFATSVLMFLAIAFRPTLYPRWMAVVNPLLVQALVGVAAAVAPPPVRLALVVTVFNGSLMIVYLISTIVLWKRLRADRTTMDGGAA